VRPVVDQVLVIRVQVMALAESMEIVAVPVEVVVRRSMQRLLVQAMLVDIHRLKVLQVEQLS
jgi:hypothetical protein